MSANPTGDDALALIVALAKKRAAPQAPGARNPCVRQMLDALSRLRPSDARHGPAVDAVGGVAMRVVADAEATLAAVRTGAGGLGREAGDRRRIGSMVGAALAEAVDLAAVFAGAPEWKDLHAYVCEVIRQLLPLPH
jgi:hypothetical protein